MRSTTGWQAMAASCLAACFVVAGSGGTVAAQPLPHSPASSPPAQPPVFSYEFDLAGASEPPTVAVPPGQMLDVTLLHAALPATYRVTADELGFEIPRKSQPRELPSRASPGVLSLPRNCPAAAEPAWTALIKGEDETKVQQSIDALRTAAGPEPCAGMAENLLIRQTRRELRNPRLVPTGRQLRVTVERLGADGARVERKWSVLFTPGRADFGWESPTEQAWIAASIVQDLNDLAWFAAGASARPDAGKVKVTVPAVDAPNRLRIEVPSAGAPVVRELSIEPHVWAPDLYADLAKALLASRMRRAAPDRSPAGASGTLAALVDLKAEVLLREARGLSDRLTRTPLDARGHEEAALLWGAFCLRESSGPFGDRRLTLSRATAHLAFARGLRAGRPPSREGSWAAILVATLAGRSREAVQLLDAQGTTTGPERAWMAALRLRNDGDWRKIESPASRTLLEQLEFVRAKAAGIDGLAALAALEGVAPEPVPDWARILLAREWSVEEGHRFTTHAIALELRELALAHGVAGHLGADFARAAELLRRRQEPIVRRAGAGPATVEVLGLGAWSAAAARNVLEQAQNRAWFLDGRGLGMPQEAADFRKAIRPLVESQPLFPLLDWSRRDAEASRGPELCTAMRGLVARSPIELPAALWAVRVENACAHTSGFPPARSFFDPPVPRGTTLDARTRVVSGSLGMGVTSSDLKGFRELAPHDSALVFASLLREYRGAIPVEVVAQEYGPFAEYQVSAARRALSALAKDPAAYRRMAEKMCALAADHCWELGHVLATAGEDDAAAVVHQRAFERGLDRVHASNNVQWLVAYFEERGQLDRALEVASDAEETGSSRGIGIMAHLLEGRGRLDEAEKRYLQIKERYDEDRSLQRFYIRSRNKPGGDRWADQADAAMKKLFPDGLERLATGHSGPPKVGAVLTQPSAALLKAGIQPGDVVAALDGYVVRDESYYGDLKALSAEPAMKLTIWHDGRYVEVEERRGRINYFQR